MESIQKIIVTHEGMEGLKQCESIRVEHEEFPLLMIEYLGKGPTDRDAVGVSQFVNPAGCGLLCQREMQFEITADNDWLPFSLLSETTGEVKEVYEPVRLPASSRLSALLRVNRKVFLELNQLAHEWDKEIERDCYLGAPKTTLYYPLFDDLEQEAEA